MLTVKTRPAGKLAGFFIYLIEVLVNELGTEVLINTLKGN